MSLGYELFDFWSEFIRFILILRFMLEFACKGVRIYCLVWPGTIWVRIWLLFTCKGVRIWLLFGM